MSELNKQQRIGAGAEEALRAYFWRAGVFVVRGVPLYIGGDYVTGIDLWVYERSPASSRRIQIVDIKYKNKPKVFERALWVKGLAEALNLSGAYLATTDVRPAVRQFANRLGLQVIDGKDLARIIDSYKRSD